MAPYPIFFRALKTIIMPNFMLLTESEQFKHISALLKVIYGKAIVQRSNPIYIKIIYLIFDRKKFKLEPYLSFEPVK